MKVFFNMSIASIVNVAFTALDLSPIQNKVRTTNANLSFSRAKSALFRIKKRNLLLVLLIAQFCCVSNASATTISHAFLGTKAGNHIYEYRDYSLIRQYFEKGNKSVGLFWQGSGEYTFKIEKRNNQGPWQSCGGGDERNSYSQVVVTNNYGNPSDEYFHGGCNYTSSEAITEIRVRRGSGGWFVVKVPLIAPFLPEENKRVQSTVNTEGNSIYINLVRMLGNDGVEMQIKTSATPWRNLPAEQLIYNPPQNRLEIKDITPGFYDIRVRSTKNGQVSNWVGGIYANVPLAKPAPFVLESVIYGGYNANWQATFGAVEYEYDYNELKNNFWHTGIYPTTTETSVSTQNSIATGPYQMRVRAITANGKRSEWAYSNEINITEKPLTPTPPYLSIGPYQTEDKGFILSTDNFSNQVVNKWRYEVQIDNGEWHFVRLTGGGQAYLFSTAQVNGVPVGVNGKINSGLYRFRVRTEAYHSPEKYHSAWTYSDYYPRGEEVSQILPPSELNTYIDVDNVYFHWPKVADAEQYQVIVTERYPAVEVYNGSTSNTQINTANLEDGNYSVKVRVIDEQGKYSRFLGQNFTIDAVPNIVSNVTTHYSNAGSNNHLTINWQSSETNVQYYLEYHFNNSYWQPFTNTANIGSPFFQPLTGSYQFRIRVRSNTTRKFSNWVLGPRISVINDENNLSSPSLISASYEQDTATPYVKVSWQIDDPVSNAGASYEVQKYNFNSSSWHGVGSTQATHLNVNNVEPGGYLYRVKARKNNFSTPFVNMAKPIELLPQSNDISVPHSLEIKWYQRNSASDFIRLGWQSNSSRGHYYIEHRLNGGAWQEFNNTANFHTLLFNPEVGGFYEFRVKTQESVGGVRSFSAWSKIASYNLVIKPEVPVLSAEEISNSQKSVLLSWSSADNIDSYNLYQSINGAIFTPISEGISGDATSFVIDRPDNGEYRFKIKACNTAGCSESVPVNITIVTKIKVKTELLGTAVGSPY